MSKPQTENHAVITGVDRTTYRTLCRLSNRSGCGVERITRLVLRQACEDFEDAIRRRGEMTICEALENTIAEEGL